jgi:p-aminobenzoyl-glutamate transporter AbgT
MLLKVQSIVLLVLAVLLLILSMVSVNGDLSKKMKALNAAEDKDALETALKDRAPDGVVLQSNAVILVIVSILLLLLENNGAFRLTLKSEPIIIVVPLFLVIFGVLSLISGTNAQLPRDQRGTIQILNKLKKLKDKNATDKATRATTTVAAVVGSVSYGICALLGAQLFACALGLKMSKK